MTCVAKFGQRYRCALGKECEMTRVPKACGVLLFLGVAILMATTFTEAQTRPDLPPELTLHQPLRLSLANYTVIRPSHARFDTVTGQLTQARSPLLPQLNFEARQAYYTASLIGLALDIPGQPSKIGPSGAMDARLIV